MLAVQTRAKAELAASLSARRTRNGLADTNADLTRSQAAVAARYDLAVEAIKTFHTGVSEDFLLKQEQFKDVRDRLLKSASDFYGKLGALLGKESDLASRRALWQANFEVAELTGKVGKPEDALAAHRQVARRSQGAGGRIPGRPGDQGRRGAQPDGRRRSTGDHRTDRGGGGDVPQGRDNAGRTGPDDRGPPRRGLPWLTAGRVSAAAPQHGPRRRSAFGLPPGACGPGALAAAPGATAESRRDLADTISESPECWRTGKSSEAEAEYRKALAIQQKLADDNPAVADFRSRLASSHNNLG